MIDCLSFPVVRALLTFFGRCGIEPFAIVATEFLDARVCDPESDLRHSQFRKMEKTALIADLMVKKIRKEIRIRLKTGDILKRAGGFIRSR